MLFFVKKYFGNKKSKGYTNPEDAVLFPMEQNIGKIICVPFSK